MSKNNKKLFHRNGVYNEFLDVNEKNIHDIENKIKMFYIYENEDPIEVLKEELDKPLFNYNNHSQELSRNIRKKTTLTKKNTTNPILFSGSNSNEENKDYYYPYNMSSNNSDLKQKPCRDQEVISIINFTSKYIFNSILSNFIYLF